jgi:hypothetical protein
MKPRITDTLTYNPKRDGNVFQWILEASEVYRQIKKDQIDAVKEASAKSKRLDYPEMAN